MRGTAMWCRRGVGVIAVVAAAAAGISSLGEHAAAATGRTVLTKKRLAPGVTYRVIQDPSGPYRIYVLDIAPTADPVVEPATSSSQMGSWVRTSVTAANAGALAAVNGDFSQWPGRPTHPFAVDGVLQQTGIRPGVSFGNRSNKPTPLIRHREARMRVRNATRKTKSPITAWNTGNPTGGQINGYNWFGGRHEAPPQDACSVRLAPVAPMHWQKKRAGVYRDYKVVARVCQSARLPVKKGTIVLSSKRTGTGATWMKGSKRRDTVRVSWYFDMDNVLDMIGGNPILLQHGIIQPKSTCKTHFCGRNPRTAVGRTADGHILLVVVDGRRSFSVGMSLYRLAQEMKKLGAESAMNLDGGGSSTMWIKGMGVVNHPTDSTGERPLSSALLVLPGSDPDEPDPLAFSSKIRSFALTTWFEPETVPTEALPADMIDVVLGDPASTGGLMDHIANQGDGARVPGDVSDMATRFRELQG